MTDNPFLKYTLYGGSTLAAWSRIQDDQHYLSQVVLGLWTAYLSVRGVDATEEKAGRVLFAPVILPDGGGIKAVLQF